MADITLILFYAVIAATYKMSKVQIKWM